MAVDSARLFQPLELLLRYPRPTVRAVAPIFTTSAGAPRPQAVDAVSDGSSDMVGLALALSFEPHLANTWQTGSRHNPRFPNFTSPPEGGVSAGYSMRLTRLAEDRETAQPFDLADALESDQARDAKRIPLWRRRLLR